MIKGVIFDLDGVLCFTDKYHYAAWKAVADERNIYFDEKINDRLRGVSRPDSLDIILERADRTYSREEKAAMAEEKNGIYRRLIEGMSPADVAADVRETLAALKEKGVKLAVGSSSKNALPILEKTGLKDCFDAVADGNDIKKSKPAPEVFLVAAKKLRLEPCVCMVVEDAETGVDAAKAGGFTAAGIGLAAKYPRTDIPLKTLKDLPRLFG